MCETGEEGGELLKNLRVRLVVLSIIVAAGFAAFGPAASLAATKAPIYGHIRGFHDGD
jgi:hypothetical protein